MIDLITLAILTLAAWHGWRRGTLLMGLAVGALVAGYVGAVLLFRPVGHLLERRSGLPALVALPAAGLFVMLAITTIIRIAMWKVERRRAAARLEGLAPSPIDGAGGAAIGVLRAGAVVVGGAWGLLTLHALVHVGPDIRTSLTGRLAGAVMRRASFALAQRVTGNPLMASVVSTMTARPGEGVPAMNAVMRDARVQRLWTDTLLRGSLARGDTDALAGSSTVRALAGDEAFLAAARQLGVLPAGTGGDQLAAQLAGQLGPLVRSVESMRNDADVRQALDNPEFRRLLGRGDFAALAADPRFNQLARKFLEKLNGTQ